MIYIKLYYCANVFLCFFLCYLISRNTLLQNITIVPLMLQYHNTVEYYMN